jgi:hypothetical protein
VSCVRRAPNTYREVLQVKLGRDAAGYLQVLRPREHL